MAGRRWRASPWARSTSRRQASVNAPETIKGLAQRMAERGVVPEWEVFDLGMIDFAHYLRTHGLLPDPVYANLLLGSLGTLAATPMNLALAVERLPAGATWAATGVGRFQFAVHKLAIAMGGHVRVGLEDNIWFDDERTRACHQSTARRARGGRRAGDGPRAGNARSGARATPHPGRHGIEVSACSIELTERSHVRAPRSAMPWRARRMRSASSSMSRVVAAAKAATSPTGTRRALRWSTPYSETPTLANAARAQPLASASAGGSAKPS